MLIGAPKTLNDLEMFSPQTLNELILGSEASVINSYSVGQPLDISTQITVETLCRLALTIKNYREFIQSIALIDSGITEPAPAADEQLKERWELAQKAAQILLSAKPKKAPPLVTPVSANLSFLKK